MNRVKVISSTIATLIFVKGYSQNITNPFETLKKKREIVYGLDNRRTHIYQHHTVIYGLYSGISFGKKLRIKIGINGTPFEIGKFVDENGIIKKNRLFFASVVMEIKELARSCSYGSLSRITIIKIEKEKEKLMITLLSHWH